ncbi:Ribonuclease III family protein [Zostera marina]|uniref:Ribonuclease III family protein n=1 Tax=Zostera marina TaxID=29655 RepID=A0A0K9NHP9_ZOSMR|nr:Ribonuclease III family protein [Zostera marina]
MSIAASPTAIWSASTCSLRLRVSWDTSPSPILTNPNVNRPPKLVRIPKSSPVKQTKTQINPHLRKEDLPASVLWNSDRTNGGGELNKKWFPIPPKVNKPRSIYNAVSLAYLGDCIYELYARRHFLFPPLSIDVYNERVMSIVRCEAQDLLLKKLLVENYLTEEERDILRWGKNIGSNKTRTRKRAGVAVYSRASSLETLIGFLYLTNTNRLENLMYKLGFSMGTNTTKIPVENSG